MEFQYAPGLPGYGTKGADGSSGLGGQSTYIAGYSGTTQAALITGHILNNTTMFANTEPLADNRTYNDGDMFIDINATIFIIDFDNSELFYNTEQSLNTSGFFEFLTNTDDPPNFKRYSNKFDSEEDRALIDIVYAHQVSSGIGKYPSTIYGLKPDLYAQIQYSDSNLMTTFKDGSEIYPYTVWRTEITSDNDSIALARELTNNVWHLGNKQTLADTAREVHLDLDFQTIGISSELHSNQADLILASEDIEDGDTFDVYLSAGSTLGGTTTGYTGGHMNINSGKGSNRTSGTGTTSGPGGNLNLFAGNGGDTSWVIAHGGEGGEVLIQSGNGGLVTTPGAGMVGGNGGDMAMLAGNGANGDLDSGGAGHGGNIEMYAGDGGNGNTGGLGGDIYIQAGEAGTYNAYNNPESRFRGGYVQIRGGSDELGQRDYVYVGCNTGGTTYSGGLAIGTGSLEFPSLSFATSKDMGFYKAGLDTISMVNDGHWVSFTSENNSGYGPRTTIEADGGIWIYAADNSDSDGDGAEIRLITGSSTTNGGGKLKLYGGDGVTDGGDIEIFGGDGDTDNGGDITITAGNGYVGGNINIMGGRANVSDFIAPSDYGAINLVPGNVWGTIINDFRLKSDIRLDVEGAYSSLYPDIHAGTIRLNLGDQSNSTTQSGNFYITHLENPTISDISYYDNVLCSISTGRIVRNYQNASDIRLKDISGVITDNLERLRDLRTIRYTWNEKAMGYSIDASVDAITKIGLVAQEVEKTYPELVYTQVKPDGFEFKNINYLSVIPALVGGINELDEINNKQQETINTLTERLEILEGQMEILMNK